jgi:hypothetical protein
VIKSHGSADVLSFANAIEIALLEVRKSVPEHIRECMEPVLEQSRQQQERLAQADSAQTRSESSQPEMPEQDSTQLEAKA